jgi:hypothetical protein
MGEAEQLRRHTELSEMGEAEQLRRHTELVPLCLGSQFCDRCEASGIGIPDGMSTAFIKAK